MYKLFEKPEGEYFDRGSHTSPLDITLTDLIKGEDDVVIWHIDPSFAQTSGPQRQSEFEKPFFIQYRSGIKKNQYSGRSTIQDPINGTHQYTLDRSKNPKSRKFLIEAFDQLDQPEIMDEFPGNQHTYFPTLHFIGDPKEAFAELKGNKYKFEWKIASSIRRHKKKKANLRMQFNF